MERSNAVAYQCIRQVLRFVAHSYKAHLLEFSKKDNKSERKNNSKENLKEWLRSLAFPESKSEMKGGDPEDARLWIVKGTDNYEKILGRQILNAKSNLIDSDKRTLEDYLEVSHYLFQ